MMKNETVLEADEAALQKVLEEFRSVVQTLTMAGARDFKSQLASVSFPLSALQGHDWSGINLAGEDLTGLDFSDCDMSGVCFDGADVAGAKFIRTLTDEGAFDRAINVDTSTQSFSRGFKPLLS